MKFFKGADVSSLAEVKSCGRNDLETTLFLPER